MTLAIEVYWSFRSPWSYLATPTLLSRAPRVGQDRLDVLLWRLQSKGLQLRT
jgi:hypothetical protein